MKDKHQAIDLTSAMNSKQNKYKHMSTSEYDY